MVCSDRAYNSLFSWIKKEGQIYRRTSKTIKKTTIGLNIMWHNIWRNKNGNALWDASITNVHHEISIDKPNLIKFSLSWAIGIYN